MEKLTAPKINRYISVLARLGAVNEAGRNLFQDQKLYEEIIDKTFELIKRIKPSGEGAYYLWLRAPRGPIEDFGNFEEEKEYGYYQTFEEFRDEWLSNYPDETEWYVLNMLKDPVNGYRGIWLNRKQVYEHQEDLPDRAGWPIEMEGAPFAQWLYDSIRQCIDEISAGTYNETVNTRLPDGARTGTITRKDLWDSIPGLRETFYEAFSEAEKQTFLQQISEQGEDNSSVGRIPEMTAGLFYTACSYGYAANPQEYDCAGKTPKELYYRYADRRDDGLKDVPEDDPAAFRSWLHDRTRFGGHPWEVMRGGNSTHVSLYVHDDDQGYYFSLNGDSVGRCVETMKFYLALREHGLPVFLVNTKVFVDRLNETESVGIVPQGVIPKYCHSWFPDEEVSSFINLPFEEPEKSRIAEKAVWQTEIDAELRDIKDNN